ncbi:class I tRNA ligase family protein, partial [Streptomyces sp. MBT49]|uniref:class I tRNA ligase family protein n=1 Tax=Streptomyces sp. MBT49 TaxID=1488380 RepID=UPI00190A8923
GRGRPGWHIECVAIALDHLGMGFDVQGGGSDLAFPHHEMGASHAQVLTGEFPMAQAYVHAGMVGLHGEKMSKSRGNLVFVSKLRQDGVDPAAIRLTLLAHHYRADWEWTDQVLADAVLAQL